MQVPTVGPQQLTPPVITLGLTVRFLPFSCCSLSAAFSHSRLSLGHPATMASLWFPAGPLTSRVSEPLWFFHLILLLSPLQSRTTSFTLALSASLPFRSSVPAPLPPPPLCFNVGFPFLSRSGTSSLSDSVRRSRLPGGAALPSASWCRHRVFSHCQVGPSWGRP